MDAQYRRRFSLALFWGALLIAGVGVVRFVLSTDGHPFLIGIAVVLGLLWASVLYVGFSIIRTRKRPAPERETDD